MLSPQAFEANIKNTNKQKSSEHNNNRLKLSHLKGSGKKQRKKCEVRNFQSSFYEGSELNNS